MKVIYNFYKNNKTPIILICLFFIIKFVTLISFNDKDWEPDSYMHFLQLKTVFYNFPENIELGFNVWAKPLYTFPLAFILEIFSFNTLLAVQLINLGVFSVISFFVYKITYKLYSSKEVSVVALVLSSLSFILFKSSISALTEPIFTLMLVLGFYNLVLKNYYISSFFFGLSILGRIEGLYFAIIYSIWLIYKLGIKKIYFKFYFLNFFIAFLPVFIWNFIGFLYTNSILFIFDKGYPTNPGIYGFGNWLDFPKRLLLQETLVFFLFLTSFFIFIKKIKQSIHYKELLLSYTFVIGFTFSQMLFWVLGQMGSAGLMRYLVSVIPFAIIASGISIQKILKYFNFEFLLLAIILFQICTITFHALGVGPISKKWIYLEDELIDAGKYIDKNYSKDTKIFSFRPEVVYYSQFKGDLHSAATGYKTNLENKEQGIYVWSKDWADIFNITLEDLNKNAKLIKNFNNFVYIYEIK